jgi:exosortase B
MTTAGAASLRLPPSRASTAVPLWLPVALGLLLLYVPTYRDIAAVFWTREQGGAGPVVLVMWLWLLWRERAALVHAEPTPGATALGWAAIALGTASYALGRSQEVFQLEAGSQLAIFPGIVLLLLGFPSTRRLWFVWVFLIFTVPLPGSLVDAVLVPMKEAVSAAVTQLLFHAGLPIARDGVVIYIGHYQLFIADACSGLNGVVALTAVGVLYVYAAGRRPWPLNALLLASIVPVAVLANLVRVTALVLATYYGGDALGQALHDYVGYAEIVLALGTFLLLDHIARLGWRLASSP